VETFSNSNGSRAGFASSLRFAMQVKRMNQQFCMTIISDTL